MAKGAGQGGTMDFRSWKPEPTTALQELGISGQSGKSPFPSLEVFVESIACIGDVQGTRVHVSSPKNLVKEYMSAVECFVIASCSFCVGRIRSWYWFSEHGVVVYNIMGNRFCERIGRQHKSNNGEHMYSVS